MSATAFAAEKPNLLFFLLDDQGKSHTGAYGNPHVPTPSLDAFAKQGMLFHNVHAPMAICAPSRSALYTGQYPFKNGCFQNHWTTWSDTKSITQRMKALGYDVILAGKSHVQPGSVFNWTMHLQGRFKEDRAIYARKGVPLDALENYFSKTNAGNKRPFCIIVASEYPHSPFAEKSTFDPEKMVLPKGVSDTPGIEKGKRSFTRISKTEMMNSKPRSNCWISMIYQKTRSSFTPAIMVE
jgi:arylsulfatase A-like enzyme